MTKTLIIHDTFLYRGGGERLVLLMARTLDADIASGFFSSGSYNLREQEFTGQMFTLMPHFFLYEFSWLPKKIAFVLKNGLRHLGLKWAFSINTKRLVQNYDTIILSGDCLACVRHLQDKKVVYYCHTIPRYLFDQKNTYEKKIPHLILPVYRCMTYIFRRSYLQHLSHISHLLTNSKNTQQRIKIHTGRDAEILYPPVDTNFFSPTDTSEIPDTLGKKEYYLSFARLSSIKRVDRIVEAFKGLPHEKLIITYGKNDPERAHIASLMQNCPHIEMHLSPSDEELRTLIRGAIATIYVPVDEDFGMSPVESMACGTPVIGVNDGGLKESIIDGKTGVLIPPTCTPTDIQDAIKKIPQLDLKSEDCIARADNFSLSTFEVRLKKFL